SLPNGTTAGGRSRWPAKNGPPCRPSSQLRSPRSRCRIPPKEFARPPMPDPITSTVEIDGFPCRVWQKGSGPKLGFLAGFGGLPRWIPFLDALARERTVIVPSLPGFPGGERGHSVLDSHLDWVLAAHQLIVRAGLDGADLAGSSVGGSLAAEVAAIWPGSVRR